MGELMLLLIMTLSKHLSAVRGKNDLPYFADMTTWGLSMTEGSASSGLMGDPSDTTRARGASAQGTPGINSSNINSISNNSINNSSIHSRFSSNSSSIHSTIMGAVTAMSSPLTAMFSPCQLRTGQ